MRVHLAAQIFSRTCSRGICVLVAGFPQVMPSDATDTADFLSFMNDLFDSLNGYRKFSNVHKRLQCRLSKTSGHLPFWNYALLHINNMQFFDSVTGKVTRPPCQDGWITTIKAVQQLWQELQDRGFLYLNLRSLNQDGLENWFSAIRQFGGDNSNPTCALFCAAFKSCVLNGLCCSDSRVKNCEDDGGELLSRLESFVEANTEEQDSLCSSVSGVSAGIDFLFTVEDLRFPEAEATHYVSGYIAKRLLDVNKTFCPDCSNLLTADPVPVDTSIIAARDVGGKLIYPSGPLYQDVEKGLKIAKASLPNIIFSDAVGNKLSEVIRQECEFAWAECSVHKDLLIRNFLILFSRITIHKFCKLLNLRNKSVYRAKATRRIIDIFRHV